MSLVTIAKGNGSRIVQPRSVAVGNADDWRRLWAAHAGPDQPAPAVDFSTQTVAAVFAGERPTPGYEVEITDTRRDGNALVIGWHERRPPRDAVAAQVIVTPFHIVSVPRHVGPVQFVSARLAPNGDPSVGRVPAAVAAAAPSSTGLDPNFAAALAYLAGPFSGMTILLAERANAHVRFHAWQAIVGLGGLALIALALLVSAFLALFVSPAAFTVLYRLSAVGAAIWLIVWAVCLYAAFTGKRWQLPLAGKYAARKAEIVSR